MHDQAKNPSKIATEKRILNEFGAKILNEERLDLVLNARRSNRHSAHSEMLFHCECDDSKCTETISMSTEEYERTHRKLKNFVVVPLHIRLDLEEVVTTFSTYVLVRKFFPHDS